MTLLIIGLFLTTLIYYLEYFFFFNEPLHPSDHTTHARTHVRAHTYCRIKNLCSLGSSNDFSMHAIVGTLVRPSIRKWWHGRGISAEVAEANQLFLKPLTFRV